MQNTVHPRNASGLLSNRLRGEAMRPPPSSKVPLHGKHLLLRVERFFPDRPTINILEPAWSRTSPRHIPWSPLHGTIHRLATPGRLLWLRRSRLPLLILMLLLGWISLRRWSLLLLLLWRHGLLRLRGIHLLWRCLLRPLLLVPRGLAAKLAAGGVAAKLTPCGIACILAACGVAPELTAIERLPPCGLCAELSLRLLRPRVLRVVAASSHLVAPSLRRLLLAPARLSCTLLRPALLLLLLRLHGRLWLPCLRLRRSGGGGCTRLHRSQTG